MVDCFFGSGVQSVVAEVLRGEAFHPVWEVVSFVDDENEIVEGGVDLGEEGVSYLRVV
jgi:hypothetical protein